MPNLSNQRAIDAFNAQLRAMPEYQTFLRSMGVNPSGPIRLSDFQRKQAEAWVNKRFGNIGKLEIDPAGNVNQDEGFSRHRKWIIPAAIGAGTLGLGAFGVGPAAGLFGGGGAAGGAAGAGAGASGAATGGTLASSSIPTSLAMQAVPASIAGSAGIPAGVSAGTAAALGGVVPNVVDQATRGLGGRLLDNLLSPEGLLTAGSIAASLAGGGDGTSDATRASEEQARRMQAITEARMRRVDPLHEAVTQLAFSRLPVSSRQGLTLPRVALPE
jgi:hypothetical protein